MLAVFRIKDCLEAARQRQLNQALAVWRDKCFVRPIVIGKTCFWYVAQETESGYSLRCPIMVEETRSVCV